MIAEKYLKPKDLSIKLEELYGIVREARYIRAIRAESVRRGEKVFISGEARVSDLYKWITDNPTFRFHVVYGVRSIFFKIPDA